MGGQRTAIKSKIFRYSKSSCKISTHLNTTVVLAPSIATSAASCHLSAWRYEGEITGGVALKHCSDIIEGRCWTYDGTVVICPSDDFDGCVFNIGRIEAIGTKVEVDSANITNCSSVIDSNLNTRAVGCNIYFHRNIVS